MGTILAKLGRFVLVTIACAAIGWGIGFLVHLIAFGIHGYGFDEGARWLALFEGGVTGAVVAPVVAVPLYYFMLAGHAKGKEWALLAVVSFCATLLVASVLPPLGPIGGVAGVFSAAVWTKQQRLRSSQDNPSAALP